MNIGYARVSTKNQNLDMQLDALKKEGCEKIFCEKISGLKIDRPEWEKVMEQLRPGDHLFVFALDRLGRSLFEIIQTVGDIQTKGVTLHAISQHIDTSSITGKVLVTNFALMADIEMTLRQERTRAGIEAARARGFTGGRPAGLSEAARKKALQVRTLYLSTDPVYSIREIADMQCISTRTLYKYLNYLNVKYRGDIEK
jgi:putative resolvase/DNA invertase